MATVHIQHFSSEISASPTAEHDGDSGDIVNIAVTMGWQPLYSLCRTPLADPATRPGHLGEEATWRNGIYPNVIIGQR